MSYRRGRCFEYAVRNHLTKKGYWVIRAAGSKGCADLVALGPGRKILMISCKLGGVIPMKEKQALFDAAQKVDAVPLLAQKAMHDIKFSHIGKKLGKEPLEFLVTPTEVSFVY